VRLGVRSGLSLVRNQNIDVWQKLIELVLEELCDERRRQVKNEDLVLRGGFLSQGQSGLHRDGQVVTSNVEELGVLDLLPDLRLLQMVHLVLVRRGEVGA